MLCIGVGPSFCFCGEILSRSRQISSTCDDELTGSKLDVWSDTDSMFSALSFSFNENKELTIFVAMTKIYSYAVSNLIYAQVANKKRTPSWTNLPIKSKNYNFCKVGDTFFLALYCLYKSKRSTFSIDVILCKC